MLRLRRSWARYHRSALVAAAGIAMTLAGFAFDRDEERDLARLRFERDVRPLATAIQRALDEPVTALQTGVAVLGAAAPASPARVERTLGDVVARHPEIASVAWTEGKAPRQGLDPERERAIRSAVERARQTGRPAVVLQPEGEAGSVAVVGLPGFGGLAAALDLDALIARALNEQPLTGLQLTVRDVAAGRVLVRLGQSNAREDEAIETPLRLADRRLVLRVPASAGGGGGRWRGWEVLVTGLVVTATATMTTAWAARRTRELNDSEQRYRLVAENVDDVISVLDLHHRLVYVSPSVTRLRGYTVEEVMAQSSTERICPGSLPLFRQTMNAALAAEAVGRPLADHVVEIETPCKDGSTVWIELRASFLRDEAGRPTHILSVARDISKRRRAEARTLALVEASRLLARSLDPDEVTRVIAAGACRLLEAETAATYTVEAESGDLMLAAVAGRAWGWPARMPAGASPTNIVLPLVARERRMGALALWRDGRALTGGERAMAETFADQAAVVLENASLHRATERQLRHSETLLNVSQALSSSLDIGEAFRRTTRAVTRALGADAGATWRVDGTGTRMMPLAGYHVPPAMVDTQMATGLPLTHPLVRLLDTTRGPVWFPDSWGDERLRDLPWLDALRHKSLLLLPLNGVEGLLGVVSLAWHERHHTLVDDERELLEAIGRQIAIGIDNVRLVEELRSRQGRLKALLEVNRQLSTIQPVDSLLRRIAEGCGRVLETTAAGFRLVEGEDLIVGGTWGDADVLMPLPRLPLSSLSGAVMRSGQPILVPDITREMRLDDVGRRVSAEAGYQSWLGVPVRTGERVVGVLTVWSRRKSGFTAEDVAAAEAFAAQATTALENARLYQEAGNAYAELSRTQAQLVQSQKMEAVGRLAGGIAHDFNNLLTVVSGRAQILKIKLADDDPMQRHVELIQRTVERTAGVTRQLLAFSRHQILDPRTLDLSDLVERMGTMLRALIGEDVALTTDLAPGLGAVHVDPSQMERVVMNLVVNARDAMVRGGQIRISTSSLTNTTPVVGAAGELPPGDWTVLTVADTGTGLTPETLTHIFEPFFTTKAAGQGTGLGLATVYGIVKQSEGHVLVDSRLGEGTCFRIALPARPLETAGADEGEERFSRLPRGSETILLVEDEADVRELVGELLTGLGYRVLTAVNGTEALVASEQHAGPIDLMLSDVIMPAMSGPEAAARLQATRPNMKVLYVSGYTDNAIAPHGEFELGVSLLMKPFDPAALARAVRRRLEDDAEVAA